MPSIVSIQHGPEPGGGPWRLYILAPDGREFRITADEIVALYAQQAGAPAARKAALLQAVRDRIATALGAVVDFDVDLAIDETTGRATRFGSRNRDRPPGPSQPSPVAGQGKDKDKDKDKVRGGPARPPRAEA
jgi:hypothetical protein